MGERLGQHFLKNKSVIPKIVAALELKAGETVIEIGPGEGALTFPLLEKCRTVGCKLIAIEKDRELVDKLKSLKVAGLEIIGGDALEVLPTLIHNSSFVIPGFKLVGNIPYYITGHLLRVIGELENKPALSVLMIQKEVAERVCAAPPKMNLLAAATQIWAEPEIIARLKPKDFDPPPKVDSAVIKLTTQQLTTKDSGLRAAGYTPRAEYYKLIKLIFKQPRKTAVNNLTNGLKITKKEAVELVKSVGLPENARPQDFRLKQLIELSTTAEGKS